MVHQGYIEPHNAVAKVDADGQATVWVSNAGPFEVRHFCSEILAMPLSQIKGRAGRDRRRLRRQDHDHLEPLAIMLARKSGKPRQARDEPRRGAACDRTVDRELAHPRQDGRHEGRPASSPRTRHDDVRGRRVSGSPVWAGAMCLLAGYDIEALRIEATTSW